MYVQLQFYTSKADRMQSGQRNAFRDVNLILIIFTFTLEPVIRELPSGQTSGIKHTVNSNNTHINTSVQT